MTTNTELQTAVRKRRAALGIPGVASSLTFYPEALSGAERARRQTPALELHDQAYALVISQISIPLNPSDTITITPLRSKISTRNQVESITQHPDEGWWIATIGNFAVRGNIVWD